MTQPLEYQSPGPEPRNPLKVPAILLIVFGGLTLLAIALYFLSRLTGAFVVTFGITLGPPKSNMVLNLLCIPLLVVMIIGAVAMLRLRSYGLAMVSAVLAVIPFTASCCCLITLPVGIWALVLLNKPAIKGMFH